MDLYKPGDEKYPDGGVIASSRPRGWSSVAADFRHHRACELPPFQVETTEICIAIACDPDCVVTRRGDGLWQRTQVEAGTVWLCSEGVVEEDIHISAWHDILHLWISPTRFQQLGDLTGVTCPPSAVRYLGGIFDEELRRDGANLLAELRRPTASGALLADSLSLSLTTRLATNYASASPVRLAKTLAVRTSDERRIQRVVSFMADNLDKEISLDELAGEACLSPFHFVRMFKQRMRMPPHRYLSMMRLERAKTQLALGKLPLAAISVMSGFATQSNFTRAFHRVTGVTPLGYRLASRWPQL